MPLDTRIERDGKALTLHWGGFHVACMVYAATLDSGIGPFTDIEGMREQAKSLMEKQGAIGISPADAFELTSYPVIGATPLNDGSYTLTQEFKFVDTTDGEELHLQAGDVLKAWRSMR